ncbi:MAG: anti-sigma B factor antagonist [Colwellia sp.]|jgi:anti-sigma B factor antagonist
MSITVNEQKEGLTLLTIQDEMTIYNVLEQKNTLSPYLKPDHKLQIDLSAVSEIDSAGMQLLMFLKNEAIRKQNELSFVHHSQAVVEVVEMFNLSSFFNDPVVILADWNDS